MNVKNAEIEDGELRFTASLLEVENAVIAFFNEQGSLKLGTLACAIPQKEGKAISSILLGERNVLITQILAERLVAIYNKIVLASTHVAAIEDTRIGSILLRLAHKVSETQSS